MNDTKNNTPRRPPERPFPYRPEMVVFADFIGYYQALDPDAEINIKTLISESNIPRATVYRYMRLYRAAGVVRFRMQRAKRRRKPQSKI